MNNGEFIRAAGGASNVGAAGPLTGVIQDDAMENHSHNFTGSISNAGTLTSGAAGGHAHNWGGWWTNDDSRSFDAASGNGDGNGNTLSDGFFWWGGSPATGNTNSNFFRGTSSGANTFNGDIWIPYDDNLSSNTAGSNTFSNSNGATCGSGWNNRTTGGNFLGRLSDNCMGHNHNVDFYAHRHWLKQRPTSAVADHTHNIPDHAHAHTFVVGSITGATGATETRPTNVAVFFWRRTL